MQQSTTYHRTSAVKRRRHRRRRRKNYLLALLVAFVFIASITVWAKKSPPKTSTNGKTSSNFASESQTAQPTPSIEEKEHSDSTNKEPTIKTSYDYAKPVPKSEAVENSYFDDAVFIGDSRTEGLILYTELSNTISYTHKGLMVDTVFTSPVINKNGQKLSVMDALRQTNFSKVYIMLGINETGWPYSSIFIEKYGKIIDEIKVINPQAIIYVQEILPVANSISQTHSYVKNEKINEFNVLIRQMAEEKQIYYIDTGNAVSDANGCLPEDAAIDGIHLTQPYCEKWLGYLKTHTITDIEK